VLTYFQEVLTYFQEVMHLFLRGAHLFPRGASPISITKNHKTMKKSFLILVAIFASQRFAIAQNIAKIDSGFINGANYKIIFPANYQKKLVMYAHGHEFMGSPSQIKRADFEQRMKPFLDRGFAVAASAYLYQGFAMPQGVDDTEALRQYFYKKHGKPDTTFMVGQSMGGGVALATMENFDKNYQGALGLCSFASRPYLQCRKEFDIYAVFNVIFPNVVPSLSNIMDPKVPYKAINPRDISSKGNTIKEGFMKDSVLAAQFAKHFDLKLSDLAMSLLFNENVLRDVAQKSGGNPFDNTNTVYSGFPDDWAINQKVERLEATVDANKIFGKYDRTGNIGKPIVMMHTIYDQLIPPQYGVTNFENMVHKMNKDKFLTVKITNGQAHCAFSPEQTGKAFDELRIWVKTGVKPKAGTIE
jgi:pimeloyl-ACP methyl ester carboxylesterase